MNNLPETPDWREELCFGIPQSFYLKEGGGWRWFYSIDGGVNSSEDYYPTEADARKACIHWRITEVLEIAQTNQQELGFVPKEHQPSDREIQELSRFVWKVLSRKEAHD